MTTPCFRLIGFLNQPWFTDVLKLIPYKHNYFVDSLGLQMMTRLIKHNQIVAMVTCLNGIQIKSQTYYIFQICLDWHLEKRFTSCSM
jgi:hypothetical protein